MRSTSCRIPNHSWACRSRMPREKVFLEHCSRSHIMRCSTPWSAWNCGCVPRLPESVTSSHGRFRQGTSSRRSMASSMSRSDGWCTPTLAIHRPSLFERTGRSSHWPSPVPPLDFRAWHPCAKRMPSLDPGTAWSSLLTASQTSDRRLRNSSMSAVCRPPERTRSFSSSHSLVHHQQSAIHQRTRRALACVIVRTHSCANAQGDVHDVDHRQYPWIMILSGVLTSTMFYAAIAPEAALQSTCGETLSGPLARIVVRNWGALIGLVGLMMIYGALNPAVRPLVLIVAGASKVIFVALVLSHGGRYLASQAGVAIAIDAVMIALFD